MSIPAARLWPPVLILFALHNAEEVLRNLPAWGRIHMPQMMAALHALTPAGRVQFGIITVLLTFAVAGAAFASRHHPILCRRLLRAFLTVMVLNFTWHIGASLWFVSVQPGAITAALFIVPFTTAYRRCAA